MGLDQAHDSHSTNYDHEHQGMEELQNIQQSIARRLQEAAITDDELDRIMGREENYEVRLRNMRQIPGE